MSPSNHTGGAERGLIIPIGGAEEKLHNPEILDSFVEVCGGRSARIAIIPTASELEDTGRNYEKLFRKLGIKHACVLQMLMRKDCHSQKFLDYIERAQGVFLHRPFDLDAHNRTNIKTQQMRLSSRTDELRGKETVCQKNR